MGPHPENGCGLDLCNVSKTPAASRRKHDHATVTRDSQGPYLGKIEDHPAYKGSEAWAWEQINGGGNNGSSSSRAEPKDFYAAHNRRVQAERNRWQRMVARHQRRLEGK